MIELHFIKDEILHMFFVLFVNISSFIKIYLRE